MGDKIKEGDTCTRCGETVWSTGGTLERDLAGNDTPVKALRCGCDSIAGPTNKR